MNLIQEFKSSAAGYMVLGETQFNQMYSKSLDFNMSREKIKYNNDELFFTTLWKMQNNKLTISVDFDWQAVLEFDPNTKWTELHKHDYIEMTYVAQGELTQLIGGRSYTFKQGEVCIIDRNSEHKDYLKGQDNLLISLCLQTEYFDDLFISEIEEDEFQAFIRKILLEQKAYKQFLKFSPRSRETNLLPLIEQIVKENKEKNKGHYYITRGLMIRLFDTLTRQCHLSLNATQMKKTNQLLFLQIEQYVRDNYKHITIKELVKEFHFQEDYFTRLFKKQIDMTFTEYITDIRLAKAEEMILSTNKTISSIIESVGYTNRYHFYNLFKNRYGKTPDQYRQSYEINK